jgi:general secretion pathway protein I
MNAWTLARARGFTLIEVLVALVIVAFGMGAVLAALSSSADNIAALREKTLAEWIALNQIADTRLNPSAPRPGSTEGDVKGFGNSDWHWRQDVIAIEAVPGLLEVAVRVRRLTPGSSSNNSRSPTPIKPASSRQPYAASSNSSLNSLFGSSSGGAYGSSSGSAYGSSGLGPLGPGSQVMKQLGATKLPTSKDDQQWIATVVGFRGDAIGPPSGEQPDWGACNSGSTTGSPGICGSSGGSSSSSGGSSSSSGASSSGGAAGPPARPSPPPASGNP